jgi:hypothetical protein
LGPAKEAPVANDHVPDSLASCHGSGEFPWTFPLASELPKKPALFIEETKGRVQTVADDDLAFLSSEHRADVWKHAADISEKVGIFPFQLPNLEHPVLGDGPGIRPK